MTRQLTKLIYRVIKHKQKIQNRWEDEARNQPNILMSIFSRCLTHIKWV